jgi:hypothetical protein
MAEGGNRIFIIETVNILFFHRLSRLGGRWIKQNIVNR